MQVRLIVSNWHYWGGNDKCLEGEYQAGKPVLASLLGGGAGSLFCGMLLCWLASLLPPPLSPCLANTPFFFHETWLSLLSPGQGHNGVLEALPACLLTSCLEYPLKCVVLCGDAALNPEKRRILHVQKSLVFSGLQKVSVIYYQLKVV